MFIVFVLVLPNRALFFWSWIQWLFSQKSKKSTETIEVEDEDWALGLSEDDDVEDSIERDPDWVKSPWPLQKSKRRTRSTEPSSLFGQVSVGKKTENWTAVWRGYELVEDLTMHNVQ